MKTKIFLSIFVVIIGFATGVYFFRPHNFHGSVIQSPDPSFNFKLTGRNGDVSLSDYRGKIVLIYFGYTYCPDICPGTLATIAQALRQIGSDATEIQTILISLDPARDTPERLEEYVAHFDPSFIGITGTDAQLAEAASLYGIFYEKHEGSVQTGYLIDHTATLLAIDRAGYLKVVFPYGTTPNELADDLKYMLRH
jgi:protein SCO1/2